MYMFKARAPVLVLRDFYLQPMVWLKVTHGEEGGTLNSLELGLYQTLGLCGKIKECPTLVCQLGQIN